MRKALTILFVLLAFGTKAQDPQVTQKFNNPLFINPALTGNGEKENRVTFLYRDQWRAVIVPYSSTYINYDRRFLEKNNNSIGGGIQFSFDKAGDGSLTTTSPSLSFAYTRHFNEKRQGLSAGVQIGYARRSIDASALTFNNQFGTNGFDPNVASGETTESAGLLNLGTGINFMSKIAKRSQVDVGFAVYNSFQPDYSYSTVSNDPRPTRYATYVFAEVFVADQWSLSPNIHFQGQRKAKELHTSLLVNYYHTKNEKLPLKLSLGAGYRNQDAALTYIGAKIKDVQVGFSFDLNTSDFSDATNSKGGFELSLKYEFGKKKEEIIPIDTIPEIDTLVVEQDTLIETVEEDTVIVEEIIVEEVEVIEEVIEEEIEPIEIIEVREALPLALYFDNDQPNPNTVSTTTDVDYVSSYDSYIAKKNEYVTKIGEEAAEEWFSKVSESKNQLKAAVAQLKSLVDKGYKIKLTLKGYTSSVAASDYNKKLAQRRIQSVLLYLKEADNNVLRPAFENGTISVKEEPIGESDKADDDSNETIDKTQLVYGTAAAYERRVEILAVEIVE